MKLNENAKLTGAKVLLVPYKRHHVAKYHSWMADERVQQLTASERLSLEEEYEMQAKWTTDEDKLAFIVLRRDTYEQQVSLCVGEQQQQQQQAGEVDAMVGDVNMILSHETLGRYQAGSNETQDTAEATTAAEAEEEEESEEEEKVAELDVMIADVAHRGLGFGSDAIRLLIGYCLQHVDELAVRHFVVKIDEANSASIGMFEKFGFRRYKYLRAFRQVCLGLAIDERLCSDKSFQVFQLDNYE